MVRIDFPELGEGQFVEIRDPKYLKWKEQKEISKSFTEGDADAQLSSMEKLALALIKNGYILDEDNRPIQFPLNEQTIQDVPAVVIEAVILKFGELKKVDGQKN
jgi:hypothetical protein